MNTVLINKDNWNKAIFIRIASDNNCTNKILDMLKSSKNFTDKVYTNLQEISSIWNLNDKTDKDAFYPSLWEWALSESLLTDSKWHYYEVKFSYPNAVLFIDGKKFAENATNSDIIDACELSDEKGVGSIFSYIGACYHGKKFII